MLSVVNRVLLGLVGLVLAAAGAVVLTGGPPFDGRADVLLSRADRMRWRDTGWWWPAVIGALAVLFVLSLCWFLVQLRRRRLQEVLVETGDGEGALLRGRALEAALLSDAESLDGVERAHVLLRGRRTTPEARMGLALDARADPLSTLDAVRAEALERARTSAGLEALPAEVRLRVARHGAERAR